MKDSAMHREEDFLAVYGSSPQCMITICEKAQDPHHVIGRGFTFGIRPLSEERKVFSSILNCAPVTRKNHVYCSFIHTDMGRAWLLSHIFRHVENKILKKEYEYREEDYAFMLLANEWLQSSPSFFRYPQFDV